MYKDKIQDMYVGQEFKNYKEMCIWFGESIKDGCSKKAQMNNGTNGCANQEIEFARKL